MAAQPKLEDLERVAQGREAEMFAWAEGRVLRLYRSPDCALEAERNVVVLKALAQSGIRVPAVFERQDVGGRPGFVMERLEGRDLLSQLAARPWKVWSVGRLCGRLQAELHAVEAPRVVESLHTRLRRQIAESDLVPEALRGPALARLGQLGEGDRLLHGDFHPGNVMVHEGQPVIIDWSNAARGAPEADLARTLLMLALGEPPPGSPFPLRALARFGGRALLRAHEKSYRKARAVDDGLLKAWRLPVAVGRLCEGIQAEREKLLALGRRLVAE